MDIGDKIIRPAAAADLYGGKGSDEYVPFGGKYEGTPGTGTPSSGSKNKIETASMPKSCFLRNKAGLSFGAELKTTLPTKRLCGPTTAGSLKNILPLIRTA